MRRRASSAWCSSCSSRMRPSALAVAFFIAILSFLGEPSGAGQGSFKRSPANPLKENGSSALGQPFSERDLRARREAPDRPVYLLVAWDSLAMSGETLRRGREG